MKTKAAPAAPVNPVAQKLSVSLFAADLERVDAILDHMKAKAGVRLNVSAALKLALRAVRLDDGLLAAWDAVQADDGRRKTPRAADGRLRKPNANIDRDKAISRGLIDRVKGRA